MRGTNKIYYRPYCPAILSDSLNNPYIPRLEPTLDGFKFEWLDRLDSGEHTVYYGPRGGDEKMSLTFSEKDVTVTGLTPDCEYEFYVESRDGRRSNVRLLHTGAAPDGTKVINYLHPEDKQYIFSGKFLCSPSIAKTASGRLIATMDIFGGKMAQNLILAFYSDDDGDSWHYLTDIYPFYWASLFTIGERVYILGLSTEYGNLQISYTEDDGETWADPTTIFYGSNVLCDFGGNHRAPMQVTRHGGRIWTSCEYGCWAIGYHLPAVLSIGEDEDLMKPENWVRSDFLKFEGEWKRQSVTQGDTIEGNLVVAPDGKLYNYMRWKIGELLKLRVDTEDLEAPLIFDALEEAPVSNSMFKLFPYGDKYILITNRKTEISGRQTVKSYRNVLTVFESYDLKEYKLLFDIINREEEDAQAIGFQYPSYALSGDRVYLVIRSAFNNAENYHNSNYTLFYKFDLK